MSQDDLEQADTQISEDEIRFRAYEFYCARIARGELGNELDDWLLAEALLKTTYPCES